MEIIVLPTAEEVAVRAAAIVTDSLARRGWGRSTGATWGLRPAPLRSASTASSPGHGAQGQVDLTRVHGFALDEYVGLPAGHPQSYREVLTREVCGPLGLDPANLHVPDGSGSTLDELLAAALPTTTRSASGAASTSRSSVSGPMATSASTSRARPCPRGRASSVCQTGRASTTPDSSHIRRTCRRTASHRASTILEARALVLVATGPGKAAAVAAAVEGPLTASCPASVLQWHATVTVVVDEAAAPACATASTTPKRQPALEADPAQRHTVWNGLASPGGDSTMGVTEPPMSIGTFSRASSISIKALRAYHAQGILEPAVVDEETGFRSYHVGQLADAAVVRRLRDLDVPLAAVREVLAARDLEVTRRVLWSTPRRCGRSSSGPSGSSPSCRGRSPRTRRRRGSCGWRRRPPSQCRVSSAGTASRRSSRGRMPLCSLASRRWLRVAGSPGGSLPSGDPRRHRRTRDGLRTRRGGSGQRGRGVDPARELPAVTAAVLTHRGATTRSTSDTRRLARGSRTMGIRPVRRCGRSTSWGRGRRTTLRLPNRHLLAGRAGQRVNHQHREGN